jgi:hypothetical protein
MIVSLDHSLSRDSARAAGGAVLLVRLGLLLDRSLLPSSAPLALTIRLAPASIVADGFGAVTAAVERPQGKAAQGPLQCSIAGNAHAASILRVDETQAGWRVRIRAGVLAGRTAVRAAAPGFLPAEARFDTQLEAAGSAGDGAPDFLRLEDDRDRQAFRRWFAFLAEAQYFQKPASRPVEIVDCAAPIRYAYREALLLHDGGWARDAGLPLLAGLESVEKYRYPYTPLGAALLRVRPAPFQPPDLSDGSFAQFSDARTLLRFNTHSIGRNLFRALPGDLLFFEPAAGRFHSMIFLGASQIDPGRALYVFYHNGPDGPNAGEMRRPTVGELMNHPDPRWQPPPSVRRKTRPSFGSRPTGLSGPTASPRYRWALRTSARWNSAFTASTIP